MTDFAFGPCPQCRNRLFRVERDGSDRRITCMSCGAYRNVPEIASVATDEAEAVLKRLFRAAQGRKAAVS
jgi:uncharacterized Zn finger protein (UPF0148 family)